MEWLLTEPKKYGIYDRMKKSHSQKSVYTVELEYLAKDCEFLYHLAHRINEITGLSVIDASGGLIFTEEGKPHGREGAISVEATSLDLLRESVDTFVAELRTTCGVIELNMVIRKDDGTVCFPYLPARVRQR